MICFVEFAMIERGEFIMLWTDLLPNLKELSRVDKLRVMEFLVVELAKDEGTLLKPNATYPIWSPYDSYQAAQQMLELLNADKQVRHA